MPRAADEEQRIEMVVRDDREKLGSFVENLSKGIAFDDMDENLRLWWLNRY